tara:strand:- start:37212 stop:37721 length:510 start_codon:yes stop_codon:yes gene_type:complete
MDKSLTIRTIVQEFKESFSNIYGLISDLDEPLRKGEFSKEDMTDIGFFLRELSNVSDDLRKEAKARSEFIGKLICLRALEDGETTTRGKYATGSSEGGVKPSVPKPGTLEFEQLCDLFKIPESNRDVIRFHWKTIREQIEQAASEGKDYPVNISTTPDFRTVYRRRNKN